ncbi:MAG: LuxR C-terminal-related transcriptional regulator [Pseudomonadota bacterium]
MKDQPLQSKSSDPLVDVLKRLSDAKDAGENWEACVAIAREMGADALNAAKFKENTHAPLWIRISTHERGGLEEYVMNDYLSVDPVLVARADDSMKEVDHLSLKTLLKRDDLTQKELECYHHLQAYGQSDYITFRIREQGEEEEMLIVFACSEAVAEELKADLDRLSVIANLFALYTVPPTPQQPEGKVPLLYEFLSDREKDVLSLLAKGMNNTQIAHELGISEVTVRLHTTGARKKMGATTRAQAIALALIRGLIVA